MRVMALLMIVGGLLIAFSCLLLIIVFDAPRYAASHLGSASFLHAEVLAAYLGGVLVAVGLGLREGRSWGWDGMVCLAGYLGVAGLLFPLPLLTATNANPASVITFFVLSVTTLTIPGILVLKYLFRPGIRAAFEPKHDSTGRVPALWIRLIAMSCFINSGIVFAGLEQAARDSSLWLGGNPIAGCIYTVVFGMALIVIGRGLYTLREATRQFALAYLAVLGVNRSLWLLFTPTTGGRFSPFRVSVFFLGVAVYAAIIWHLHTRRHLFSDSGMVANAELPQP